MADLGEEAFSSQMKVVATFLRLLEELMRNKQQDLRYGTKTQRRGILGRMKDFVGGIFKKVYDGTFGRLSRNGKDYGQLDLNDPAVAKAMTFQSFRRSSSTLKRKLKTSSITFRIKTNVFMFSRDFSIHTHRLRSNWITRCFPSSPPPAKTPSRSAPMNTDSGKVSTLSCR